MTLRVMVTGGSGFVGSTLIKHLVRDVGAVTLNASRPSRSDVSSRLVELTGHDLYRFAAVDVTDRSSVRGVLRDFRPDLLIHLAAETRLDHPLDDTACFFEINVLGTAVLLQEAHRYWCNLPQHHAQNFRFHHVSTVEVFGSLPAPARADEATRYNPSSPYSASKAGADHIVRAWHRTAGLPVILSISGNNYGPHQASDRLIPVLIANAFAGEPLPLYGQGLNVRDWIYVEDHARALWNVAARGVLGDTYLIGADAQKTNIDVARAICRIVDELEPDRAGPRERLISFVADRPANDFRYAIDGSRLTRELGWAPREDFESGLRRTVIWYRERRDRRYLSSGPTGVAMPAVAVDGKH